MNTNEEMLTDISAELDKEFGAPGSVLYEPNPS